MQVINMKQGSDEWHKIRLGKITGTRLKAVMGGPQAQETLLFELIAEQLSGQSEKIFVNNYMQWGTDHEDEAVAEYEKRFQPTEQVGFCLSDEFPYLGLSPDRLIKKGKKYVKAVEVKCPATKTFIKYKLSGTIPDEYIWQVTNYFLVCDTLKELDFVVYDPRIIDPDLRLSVVTVKRSELKENLAAAKERLVVFHERWRELYDLIKK